MVTWIERREIEEISGNFWVSTRMRLHCEHLHTYCYIMIKVFLRLFHTCLIQYIAVTDKPLADNVMYFLRRMTTCLGVLVTR